MLVKATRNNPGGQVFGRSGSFKKEFKASKITAEGEKRRKEEGKGQKIRGTQGLQNVISRLCISAEIFTLY